MVYRYTPELRKVRDVGSWTGRKVGEKREEEEEEEGEETNVLMGKNYYVEPF